MTETDILAVRIKLSRLWADALAVYPPDMTAEEAMWEEYQEGAEASRVFYERAAQIIDAFTISIEQFGKALTPIVESLAASLAIIVPTIVAAQPWYRRWWFRVKTWRFR